MKNKMIITIIIVCVIILALTNVFFLLRPKRSLPNIVDIHIESPYNYITIPVNIEGEEFLFMWDSGCTLSKINSNVIKKLDIKPAGAQYSTYPLQYREEIKYDGTAKPLNIKIGNTEFSRTMVAPIYAWNGSDYKDQYIKHDGVIGCDIIYGYFWLFDFVEKKVTMSKTPLIEYDINDSRTVVLEYEPISATTQLSQYVNLSFNDSIKSRLLFDTGNSPIFSEKDEIIKGVDFHIFNKNGSGIDSLLKTMDSFEILGLEKVRIWSAPMKIEETDFKNINFAIDEYHYENYIKDGLDGFITIHFVLRFSSMYFDPVNRKIILKY